MYSPYYVGKGSGNRCYSNNGRHAPRPRNIERIRKVFHTDNENEALEVEKTLINFYGRRCEGGILYNILESGELSGDNPEVRRRQSISAKKKWENPEFRKSQCEKLKNSAKGKPGNKYRCGMKNKSHHKQALVVSNRDRGEVSEIKKGAKTLYMTRGTFCEWFGYSKNSMYLCLRKRGHYKGWKFSPVS